MKICVTCHLLKPLEDYNLMRRAKDGRQPRCRDCCKAWYVSNSATHKANAGRRKREYTAECQERLRRYFEEHPCVDCGEWDLRVLEFDHRDGVEKVANIGTMLRQLRAWPIIEAEIAKCDVRCANCHRRRTAEQFPSWRQRAWLREVPPPEVSPRERLALLLPVGRQGP